MRLCLTGFLTMAVLLTATAAQASSVGGRWRTQMHGALVEIKECADRSPCAFLVWIDPQKAGGVTQDLRNPDPALRSRPLVGTPILWGLKASRDGWKGGRVYNPETGQIFKSSMQRISNDKLRITGCWGPLCRSEIWIRAQ